MIANTHEFLEANHGRLLAIGQEVGRILDAGSAFELYLQSFDEQAVLVRNAFTPQAIMDHSIEPITQERAQGIAQKETRYRADFGIDRIQDAVVVASVYDCDLEGNVPDSPGVAVPPLNFEEAVYRSDSVVPGYKLHEVTVRGLERQGDAQYWVLDRKEDTAKVWLASMSIQGHPIHVHYEVAPPLDHDLMRWMRYLGPAYESLGYTLAGVHKDEAELDARLSRTAELFAGTDREKEVWDVLLEIRARAIAKKAATEMANATGADLPTVAFLDETIDFLRAVD